MKWDFKPLPNKITLIRFLLVPVLWVLAFAHQSVLFGILLLVAGLSDWADGYIARKYKIESDFGIYFDSLSDDMVNVSLLFWMILLLPQFILDHLVVVGILVVLLVLVLGGGFWKYRRLPSWHLYSFKITNWFLYGFFVLSVLYRPIELLFYVFAAIAALALTEAIVLTIQLPKLESNRKTILK